MRAPLRRWEPAACAAGMALATAGTWLRIALDRTPRIDTHAGSFVLASAVAGAGILLAGFGALRLLRSPDPLDRRASWGWAVLTHLAALGAVALTSSDVFASLAFGALRQAGLSPYAHAPTALGGSPLIPLVASRWVHDPSPYGPLFHWIAAIAAWWGERLHAPLWGAFYAYKLLLAGALLAALAVAWRHLRRAGREDAHQTWAFLALGPLLAWEVSSQAHNDGLLFLALVIFFTAAAASRHVLATVALAGGVAVKYALAPLLGLYLILVARRSIVRASGLALVALAVVAAAFAPDLRTITLAAVLPMVGGEAARHAHSFTDLVCLVLDGAGLPFASAMAYRLLSAISAVLCLGVLARTAWRARTVPELGHGYLLFLMALFLTAPWFQPWYVVWALPVLLVEPDPRWRAFVAVYAVLTVALWAVPLDPITTVAVDAWAARQIWLLRRGAPTEAVVAT